MKATCQTTESHTTQLYAQKYLTFSVQTPLLKERNAAAEDFRSLAAVSLPRTAGLSVLRCAQQEPRSGQGRDLSPGQSAEERGQDCSHRPGEVLHQCPDAVHMGGQRRRGQGEAVGEMRGPGGARQSRGDRHEVRVQQQTSALRGLPGRPQGLLETGDPRLQEAQRQNVQRRPRFGEGRHVQACAPGRALQAGYIQLGGLGSVRRRTEDPSSSSSVQQHRAGLPGARRAAEECRGAVRQLGQCVRLLLRHAAEPGLLETECRIHFRDSLCLFSCGDASSLSFSQ